VGHNFPVSVNSETLPEGY